MMSTSAPCRGHPLCLMSMSNVLRPVTALDSAAMASGPWDRETAHGKDSRRFTQASQLHATGAVYHPHANP
jgi:hypothetical protein